MNFSGKTTIITGAAHGIGRKIAELFVAFGSNLVLADVDTEAGELFANELRTGGGNVLFVTVDVSQPDDILRLVEATYQHFGSVDIVINNAGISRWKSPYDLETDEWDLVLNTNLRSVFLLSRAAAGYMKERGGAIVNIASTRAFMSEPHSEAYAASKGGIVALTHALAASFAPDRIQVNCISPGWIETGSYENLRESDHLQHFSGRVGKPEDVARACLFLSDTDNNFISGTNLTIDGGMTHKMIYEPD